MKESTEDERVIALQSRFMNAMKARQKGDVDSAAELLLSIIKVEPRLPEPHMELAHILLGVEKYDDALSHAQEAVRYLEMNGQWLDDIEENVLLSMAYNILGESYRKIADQDEIVFGDAEKWEELIKSSKSAYQKAAALDPENAHANFWGGFNKLWERK